MDQFYTWMIAGMIGGFVGGVMSTYIVLATVGFYRNRNLEPTKLKQE